MDYITATLCMSIVVMYVGLGMRLRLCMGPFPPPPPPPPLLYSTFQNSLHLVLIFHHQDQRHSKMWQLYRLQCHYWYLRGSYDNIIRAWYIHTHSHLYPHLHSTSTYTHAHIYTHIYIHIYITSTHTYTHTYSIRDASSKLTNVVYWWIKDWEMVIHIKNIDSYGSEVLKPTGYSERPCHA